MTKFSIGDRVIINYVDTISRATVLEVSGSYYVLDVDKYKHLNPTPKCKALEKYLTIDPQWYREQRLKGLLG